MDYLKACLTNAHQPIKIQSTAVVNLQQIVRIISPTSNIHVNILLTLFAHDPNKLTANNDRQRETKRGDSEQIYYDRVDCNVTLRN